MKYYYIYDRENSVFQADSILIKSDAQKIDNASILLYSISV